MADGKDADLTKQFNVRVSERTFETIKAAVFIRRLRSPQQLLGPVAEALGAELALEEDIATVMRLRSEAPDNLDNVVPIERRPT